jgi:hypothetical protein
MGQGLLSISKGDFISLFRLAYASAFTRTNIITSFGATGIWPMDPSRVTDKFKYTSPPPNSDRSDYSLAGWKRME